MRKSRLRLTSNRPVDVNDINVARELTFHMDNPPLYMTYKAKAKFITNDTVKKHLLTVESDFYSLFYATSFEVDKFMLEKHPGESHKVRMTHELLSAINVDLSGAEKILRNVKNYEHFKLLTGRFIQLHEVPIFTEDDIKKYNIIIKADQILSTCRPSNLFTFKKKLYVNELLSLFFLPESEFCGCENYTDLSFKYTRSTSN